MRRKDHVLLAGSAKELGTSNVEWVACDGNLLRSTCVLLSDKCKTAIADDLMVAHLYLRFGNCVQIALRLNPRLLISFTSTPLWTAN